MFNIIDKSGQVLFEGTWNEIQAWIIVWGLGNVARIVAI